MLKKVNCIIKKAQELYDEAANNDPKKGKVIFILSKISYAIKRFNFLAGYDLSFLKKTFKIRLLF